VASAAASTGGATLSISIGHGVRIERDPNPQSDRRNERHIVAGNAFGDPVETIGQIQPASIPTFITAVASIVTWIARLSLAPTTCGMNEE
jgi:hypothetical protein